jgi:hypothetical protein
MRRSIQKGKDMKKLFPVTVLALIALAFVPAQAQAPGDTFTLNWNGSGPDISSDYSLLQNVTAMDDSGKAIHGTQIGVTALYEKPANQWSEGVTCVNGSMIELTYLLTDGSLESLALPLKCAGSGTGMSGTFSGEDNSGRTITGSVTVLLKVECGRECRRNAKNVSVSVSYPSE